VCVSLPGGLFSLHARSTAHLTQKRDVGTPLLLQTRMQSLTLRSLIDAIGQHHTPLRQQRFNSPGRGGWH
jgi:hypothetical protein